ncbi:TPA: hypothetical protein ACH3X1_005985 [Trebouxia sp. C0004]
MRIVHVLKAAGSNSSAELGVTTQVVLQITYLAVRHRCAGLCLYERAGGCRIKLSEPLLKFRPSIELKETLLHEMIHAWMFLEKIKDQGGHGPRFQERMNFINRASFADHQRPPQGYSITVYHSMHAEVDQYRTHHWQCSTCGNVVKRAMNRPPQEADCRGRQVKGSECKDPKCAYHMHQRFCGGGYTKIAEPEGYGKKGSSSKQGSALPAKRPRTSNTVDPDATRSNKRVPAITDFFNSISRESGTSSNTPSIQGQPHTSAPSRSAQALPESDRTDAAAGPNTVNSEGPHASANADSKRTAGSDASSGAARRWSGQQPSQHEGHAAGRGVSQVPLDYMRRIMADAPTRRLTAQAESGQLARPSHETAGTQCNTQLLTQNQPSSDAKPDVGKDLHTDQPAPACDDHGAHVSAVIDLIDENDTISSPTGLHQACADQKAKLLCCPICGHKWSEQTTNSEMNEHVDTCLAMQLLRHTQVAQ